MFPIFDESANGKSPLVLDPLRYGIIKRHVLEDESSSMLMRQAGSDIADGKPQSVLVLKDAVESTNNKQPNLNNHRWRVPGFLIGVGLFLCGFGLIAYSAERFTIGDFQRLESAERNLWFKRSGCAGMWLGGLFLFVGGFLMLIWPRLV